MTMRCCVCSKHIREHGTVSADYLPGVGASFTTGVLQLLCCSECYADPQRRGRFWREVRQYRRTLRWARTPPAERGPLDPDNPRPEDARAAAPRNDAPQTL